MKSGGRVLVLPRNDSPLLEYGVSEHPQPLGVNAIVGTHASQWPHDGAISAAPAGR